mgnify:FL=1
MAENPNVATLQTGLGRSSRRTGNRIDRLVERTWIVRQQIVFPYGPVAIAISVARTYYTRAVLLGMPFLLEQHRFIPPGALFMTIGAYLLWECLMGGYLWMSGAPKFDLSVRVMIAVVATALTYGHLYEGLCHGAV